MSRWKPRPSPALIVACLALAVALSGTGVAAVSALVPRNSVGTPQLQRNAVKSAKIAPSAVRTGHVLDGSLLSVDFKAGQIPAGPQGPAGAAGPQGPAGPQGRWAQVLSTGAIAAQSGGISVIHGGSGFWFVTFTGATVVDKPVLASTSRTSGTAPPNTISATPCGGAPQGVTCSQSNNTNTVLVNAANNTGALTDTSFYVMVVP